MAVVGVYAAAPSHVVATAFWIASAASVGLMLVSVVVGRSRPVQWSIGLMAGTYVASLILQRASLDPRSPLVAAALLAAAELANWSIDCRLPRIDETGIHVQRGLAIAAVTGVAMGLASIVLAGSELAFLAGNTATAVGTGAVVLALVVVAIIAWRHRPVKADFGTLP